MEKIEGQSDDVSNNKHHSEDPCPQWYTGIVVDEILKSKEHHDEADDH